MKSLIILGRQPAIGLAELESLYGANKLKPLKSTTLVDLPADQVDFNRLGGSLKLAEVLAATDKSQLKNVIFKIIKNIDLPTGHKINVGLSAYDFDISSAKLQAMALSIKKILKAKGFNARVVPNQERALSSATVYHNKLTSKQGIELLIVGSQNQLIIARTVAVQDIEAYAARDQQRPKRDSRVGMLSPKLAQIIINLASSPETKRLLDPFCGTGVILQEALLMGFEAYGTDLESRMVEYSKANIDWLKNKYVINKNVLIQIGDAKNYTWEQPITTVATETYLGKPFSIEPSGEQLQETINQANILHKNFIQNIYNQLQPGARLCLAVPAWHIKERFIHLPVLDQLKVLGYNRVAFKYSDPNSLIYHRPGQIVARELVILTRN